MENNNRGLVSGIFALLLLSAGILVLGNAEISTSEEPITEITEEEEVPSEVLGGIFNPVDINSAQTPEEKLPEGFPNDLPVNMENIVESFNIDYSGVDSQEASVVFRSESSISNLFSQYLTYFEENGYSIEQDSLTERDAALFAASNAGSISVAIMSGETDREVSVHVTR